MAETLMQGRETSTRPSVELIGNAQWGREDLNTGAKTDASRIPPLNAMLAIRYDTDKFWWKVWGRFAARQEKLSSGDIGDNRISPTGTPGWGTLNLQSGYRFNSKVEFSLGLENAFNKDYREHASGVDSVGMNLITMLKISV